MSYTDYSGGLALLLALTIRHCHGFAREYYTYPICYFGTLHLSHCHIISTVLTVHLCDADGCDEYDVSEC